MIKEVPSPKEKKLNTWHNLVENIYLLQIS